MFYVGLDIHDQRIAICVLGETGQIVRVLRPGGWRRMDVWEVPQSSRSGLDRGFLMDVGPMLLRLRPSGDVARDDGHGWIAQSCA